MYFPIGKYMTGSRTSSGTGRAGRRSAPSPPPDPAAENRWTTWGGRGDGSAMRQEDIWDAEVASNYDRSDAEMFAAGVLEPTVERLAGLAGPGRALEFA